MSEATSRPRRAGASRWEIRDVQLTRTCSGRESVAALIAEEQSDPEAVSTRVLSHRDKEQIRRDRINQWIARIKDLLELQEGEDVKLDKVTILQKAAEYIEDMREMRRKLVGSNRALRKRLADLGVVVSDEEMPEEGPSGLHANGLPPAAIAAAAAAAVASGGRSRPVSRVGSRAGSRANSRRNSLSAAPPPPPKSAPRSRASPSPSFSVSPAATDFSLGSVKKHRHEDDFAAEYRRSTRESKRQRGEPGDGAEGEASEIEDLSPYPPHHTGSDDGAGAGHAAAVSEAEKAAAAAVAAVAVAAASAGASSDDGGGSPPSGAENVDGVGYGSVSFARMPAEGPEQTSSPSPAAAAAPSGAESPQDAVVPRPIPVEMREAIELLTGVC
eukprot:tig00020943_g16313.t1